MPRISLYIDSSTGNLISGLNRAAVADVSKLPLSWPDTIGLDIYLMTPTQVLIPSTFPYSILSTDGLALSLEFSNGFAGPSRTIYAAQYAWNTDADNQFFYGSVALGTDEMEALVQAKEPADNSCYLKIQVLQGGVPIFDFSWQVNIGIGIGAPASVPVPGQTALTAEVAAQTYIPINGVPGEGIMLVTPNGKKIYLQAVDNADGTASFDASPVN